jgi:hypothetical protein
MTTPVPNPGPAPFPLDPNYKDWEERNRKYQDYIRSSQGSPDSMERRYTPKIKATPDLPKTTTTTTTSTAPAKRKIKIATSNLFADLAATIPPELMTRRIFEEIGGMELLEISRTDTIDGVNQEYSPIYNLADLNTQYDPNSLISFQGVDKDYFQSLEISLEQHIPDYGTGPDGSIVYIDRDITSPTYNSLIINTVRVQDWERVEVDFLTYNVSLNDTIVET